jgi:drug/metabolite transporter (DMT)-like permease
VTSGQRGWLVPYVLLALIWGGSFYFIKLGLQSLTPAGVALSRLALGLLTLLVVSAVTRTRLPSRSVWVPLFIAAAAMTSVPWLLFAYGEQHISSALAGIINGATPLMTLVAILLAFPEEKPTRQRVLGLVVGFAGVHIVMGVWQGLVAGTALGMAACVAAVGCYGFAFPYVRRHLTGGPNASALTPIALATGLMIMGTAQALPLTMLTGYAHRPIGYPAVLGMLALGCLGSGLAYILNFRVISRADATTASTVTYLTPLVAVAAGELLLGEHITWNQPVGGLLVVLGASIAQGLVRPQRRRPATSGG